MGHSEVLHWRFVCFEFAPYLVEHLYDEYQWNIIAMVVIRYGSGHILGVLLLQELEHSA